MGSTGEIMRGISKCAAEEGYVVYQAYPQNRMNLPKESNDIILCGLIEYKINEKLAYLSGFNGCFAFFSTAKFLHKLKKIKPDIIHIHNLHNSYINFPMLFNYIKRRHIQVIWTLHDCWAFTGHCPHFIMEKCDKWMEGCFACTQLSNYPSSRVDRSRFIWKLKKSRFTGVNNLTIVTPSEWLEKLVQKSFLNEYPHKTINNGINLNVFKPTDSEFRRNHHIENKYVILGVSFEWNNRKGLDTFIELNKRLNHDSNKYVIVLVGTDNEVDKLLPNEIISIHKTQNQKKLAEIYTAANVFVNPTREDNFPTVNIEALACGTPVITFQAGGSSEIIDDTCGISVKVNDINTLITSIKQICTDSSKFTSKNCIERALRYEKKKCYEKYIELYKSRKMCGSINSLIKEEN